jgi:hypothetical protein
MAVGTAGDGVHVIAEQWNGGTWTAQALDPSVPTPDDEFVDVFAVSCWNPSKELHSSRHRRFGPIPDRASRAQRRFLRHGLHLYGRRCGLDQNPTGGRPDPAESPGVV